MSMHLERFEKLATETVLKQIIRDYDKLDPRELRKQIITVLKELQPFSYFLISYDFKKNNNIVKKTLLNNTSERFYASVNHKTVPNSTLIWQGPAQATQRDAFDAFKIQVRKIIKSNDLETELSKTIIVEILDPEIIVDER